MTKLFLTNIPYDCEDAELRRWFESQGFDVNSLHVIRDLVAGVFLMGLELSGQLFGMLSGQDTRKIHDASGQRGNVQRVNLKGCEQS